MQGQLFSQDFLTRGVLETPPPQELDASSTINEAQTASPVINKVLVELGWGDASEATDPDAPSSPMLRDILNRMALL
jgi:hypothetical protein